MHTPWCYCRDGLASIERNEFPEAQAALGLAPPVGAAPQPHRGAPEGASLPQCRVCRSYDVDPLPLLARSTAGGGSRPASRRRAVSAGPRVGSARARTSKPRAPAKRSKAPSSGK